jgi:hypothetical protein
VKQIGNNKRNEICRSGIHHPSEVPRNETTHASFEKVPFAFISVDTDEDREVGYRSSVDTADFPAASLATVASFYGPLQKVIAGFSTDARAINF